MLVESKLLFHCFFQLNFEGILCLLHHSFPAAFSLLSWLTGIWTYVVIGGNRPKVNFILSLAFRGTAICACVRENICRRGQDRITCWLASQLVVWFKFWFKACQISVSYKFLTVCRKRNCRKRAGNKNLDHTFKCFSLLTFLTVVMHPTKTKTTPTLTPPNHPKLSRPHFWTI